MTAIHLLLMLMLVIVIEILLVGAVHPNRPRAIGSIAPTPSMSKSKSKREN